MALSKGTKEKLVIALADAKAGKEVANAIDISISILPANPPSINEVLTFNGTEYVWAPGGGAGSGIAQDGSNTPTADINWGGFSLLDVLDIKDNSSITSIAPNDRTAYDAAGTVSVNWGTREVNFASGNSAISWFNEGIVEILNNATLKVSGDLRTYGALGVGNSVAATTVGIVTKKIEVFDAVGVSIGFIPVYGSIT